MVNLEQAISWNIYDGCLTIVIKPVRDLMSNDHSYSSEVKSLVLMFTKERWL